MKPKAHENQDHLRRLFDASAKETARLASLLQDKDHPKIVTGQLWRTSNGALALVLCALSDGAAHYDEDEGDEDGFECLILQPGRPNDARLETYTVDEDGCAINSPSGDNLKHLVAPDWSIYFSGFSL